MNSGIVIKIYKGYVIVLTDTCEYLKIRIGALTPHIGEIYIGEVIDVKPNGYYIKKYKLLIILLFTATIIGISYLGYQYFKPVNYVYIKGYEEINIKINRFNRVISVDSLNTSADKVLKDVNILHKKASESIIILFDNSIDIGVIDEDFRLKNNIYTIKITDTTTSIDLSPVISHLKKINYKTQVIYNGGLLYESNN